MSNNAEHGAEYEDEHVHAVYQEIASHFSSTRYKPWPIVESFLSSLNPGSVGLDIGCGNGKYLPINHNVFIIASDRSANLVDIAAQHNKPHQALVADTMALPHPAHSFDFAISIAVLHHLSTSPRRMEAVKEILQTLKAPSKTQKADVAGKALIYVWALEQKGSRRGWDEGDEQDVMVPWVMKVKKAAIDNTGSNKSRKAKARADDLDGPQRSAKEVESGQGGTAHAQTDRVFNRYYHLYRKGELEQDIQNAGGMILQSGYEKDNWWAIAVRDPAVAAGGDDEK